MGAAGRGRGRGAIVVGNAGTAAILDLLRDSADEIRRFVLDPEAAMLVLVSAGSQ